MFHGESFWLRGKGKGNTELIGLQDDIPDKFDTVIIDVLVISTKPTDDNPLLLMSMPPQSSPFLNFSPAPFALPAEYTLRQRAAFLLNNLLEEALTPQQVINRWPTMYPSDDSSLNAAYQMIWHLEADEELQAQEPLYLDTQLATLELAYQALGRNESLPDAILVAYPPRPSGQFYAEKSLIEPLVIKERAEEEISGVTKAFREVANLLTKLTSQKPNHPI